MDHLINFFVVIFHDLIVEEFKMTNNKPDEHQPNVYIWFIFRFIQNAFKTIKFKHRDFIKLVE